MNRLIPCALSATVACAVTVAPALASDVPPVPWDTPAATGFAYGVASGEVDQHSAVLWGRPGQPGKVTLEVGTDRAFKKVAERRVLDPTADRDFTVRSRVEGLRAGTRYFYRFVQGKQASDVGQIRTAPGPRSKATVRFAFSGDAQATADPATGKPFFNNFEAFDAMTDERNDFNVLLGDTIYSDTQVGGDINGVELESAWTATTVAEKWSVYRQNLNLAPMARFRGATSLFTHWDDHEFVNNFTREDDGSSMFSAGKTAFADYTPLPKYSPKTGYYRTTQWGKNLQIYFLDQVSFRTGLAEKACINPITGAPDLAPTLAPAIRNTYKVIVPSMAWQVSEECLSTINSPKRQVLGKAQIKRFVSDLRTSKAAFKVVLVQQPIQELFINQYDRLESYAAERTKLLKAMQRVAPKNVIFLTTDVHANFIGDVRLRTFGNGAPTRALYREVTTGPIAATTHKQQLIGGADRPQIADMVRSFFYTAPVDPKGKAGGLGITCANLNTYSYGQVKVTDRKLQVTLKDLNGKRVLSEGSQSVPVGKPCPVVELKHR